MNALEFFQSKQTARATNSNPLYTFGTLREYSVAIGATAISNPRPDKTGFHIALYNRNAEGRPQFMENIFFSKALKGKHETVAYDIVGLLDQPIYGTEYTDDKGNLVRITKIGVTQGTRDDINDLADLMAMGAVNASTADAVK